MDRENQQFFGILGAIVLTILLIVVSLTYIDYQKKVLFVTHEYEQHVVLGTSELVWQRVKQDTLYLKRVVE